MNTARFYLSLIIEQIKTIEDVKNQISKFEIKNSKLEVDGKEMANTVNRVNAKQKLQYGIA